MIGYVVDLRSNPGGLLDQAIEVSDAFLERGEIVSQRGRENADIERYYARPGDLARAKPIVVLVDSRSEAHTSELPSLMRLSYAVICLKKTAKNKQTNLIP